MENIKQNGEEQKEKNELKKVAKEDKIKIIGKELKKDIEKILKKIGKKEKTIQREKIKNEKHD
jgi:hypothetical protein